MDLLLNKILLRLRRGDELTPYAKPSFQGPQENIKKQNHSNRAAAVLIPILIGSDEPNLLFTRRCANLREHAGQISFPGGRPTPADTDLQKTALREAYEEIGLHESDVSIVGVLPSCRTSTSYEVTPFVGVLKKPFVPSLNLYEVSEVFESPVAFFLKTDSLNTMVKNFKGQQRTYLTYQWREHSIWGATAVILSVLMRALHNYAAESNS